MQTFRSGESVVNIGTGNQRFLIGLRITTEGLFSYRCNSGRLRVGIDEELGAADFEPAVCSHERSARQAYFP